MSETSELSFGLTIGGQCCRLNPFRRGREISGTRARFFCWLNFGGTRGRLCGSVFCLSGVFDSLCRCVRRVSFFDLLWVSEYGED